jgi:hypothetical protein
VQGDFKVDKVDKMATKVPIKEVLVATQDLVVHHKGTNKNPQILASKVMVVPHLTIVKILLEVVTKEDLDTIKEGDTTDLLIILNPIICKIIRDEFSDKSIFNLI